MDNSEFVTIGGLRLYRLADVFSDSFRYKSQSNGRVPTAKGTHDTRCPALQRKAVAIGTYGDNNKTSVGICSILYRSIIIMDVTFSVAFPDADLKEIHDMEIGTMVEVPSTAVGSLNDTGPVYGVIKWIGKLEEVQYHFFCFLCQN